MQLDQTDSRFLRHTIDSVRAGDLTRANKHWSELIQSVTLAGVPRDVDGLVTLVLRDAILKNDAELRPSQDRLRFLTDQKRFLAQALDNIRTYEANFEGDANSRAILLDRIAQLTTMFQDVSDDAQLANVDLQNVLQRQQQTLQLISNISKMLHDTAVSVIRKIGG